MQVTGWITIIKSPEVIIESGNTGRVQELDVSIVRKGLSKKWFGRFSG